MAVINALAVVRQPPLVCLLIEDYLFHRVRKMQFDLLLRDDDKCCRYSPLTMP